MIRKNIYSMIGPQLTFKRPRFLFVNNNFGYGNELGKKRNRFKEKKCTKN